MGKKKEVVVDASQKKEPKVKKAKEPQKEEITKVKSVKKPLIKVHGKNYLKAKSMLDRNKFYSLKEIIAKLQSIAFEKFDSTFEIHLNLTEKNLKGEVNLPHGTGREVRIAIFSPEVEAKIEANKLDFDILIASPKDMVKLVKFAKVLGPKGLMPSPKKGTLTDKVEEAVKKLSSGTVLFKSEPKFPILHQSVGRKSFKAEQIAENVTEFIKAVGRKNILAAYLKTSMSPSLKLDLSTF
jgi:large subunit ribosomal protein L1